MKFRPADIVFAFSLLIVGTRIAPAGTQPVSIRFLDQAEVDGEIIRLGDIARIMAGEEKVVAQLETLEVAKSAAFGLTRLIDSDMLFAHVLKPWASKYQMEFDHKSIHVTTRADVFPNDSLAALIEKFLAACSKAPGQKNQWEVARAPSRILVPVTAHSLELSFSGMRRRGKVELNLAVRGETRVLRNLQITVNIRVEQPMAVATKLIAPETVLGPDNLSIEMRETTGMDDQSIIDPQSLMGKLAKVSITPGRLVTPRLVTLPPAVRRGQGAKIVFRNGNVSVVAEAVCRQDGITGQIIMAKNLASNRLVRVRVTGDGILEPVPGG